MLFCETAHSQAITTVAGNGILGFSGDGGTATNAAFNFPYDVCKDTFGNLYVIDINNARIRKIDAATGIISTFAGNGNGFQFPSGDGGNALNASIYPYFIFPGKSGIYLVDNAHATIRKIDLATGIINRVAGTANPIGSVNDGQLATNTFLAGLTDACVDNAGNLYYITSGFGGKIKKVDAITGIISTIAGNGVFGVPGDNGLAINAWFKFPVNICIDRNDNIYMSDAFFKIRKIDLHTGIVSVIAGTGVEGNTGDGGLAINASISMSNCLRTDGVGNLYFSDGYYNNIRKIDISTGIISTIAGIGVKGFSPDGTLATSAMLNNPLGIFIDEKGDLYFTEQYSRLLRKITAVAPTVCTPQITISCLSSNICANQSITFSSASVNAGITPKFEWYKNDVIVGSSESYIASSLNNNDVIKCKLTSNANCAIQSTVFSNAITVTVNPVANPTVNVTAASQIICAGSAGVFTAIAGNSGSAVSYQWKINQINAGINSLVFSSTNFKDNDIVSCVITTNNTCGTTNVASSNAIQITVNPLVYPSVSIVANANTVCEGTNIDFTAFSVNGGQSPQYVWNVNGTDISNTKTNNFSSGSFKDKDVITCVMKSNADCLLSPLSISNSIAVSIIPLPAIIIQASSTTICKEQLVNFIASGTNLGNTPIYQWQINGNNSGSDKGIFSTATLNNGDKVKCILKAGTLCSSPLPSNEIGIIVNELPSVKIDSVQIIVKGHFVQFSPVVSSNVSAYQWTPSSGLDKDNIPDPRASPLSTLTYTILVSTMANCEASANVKVIVLDQVNAPNVFSPNGDGINDTWRIPGLSSYPGCTVSIYNRGGQQIYQSTGYDTPWDGSYGGIPVPIGTYYYVINPKNGFALITGSVTVIR